MATDFNKNAVSTEGGIKPKSLNTPGDVRTRIETIADVSSIPLPYIGMIFYVIDEDKYYSIKTLADKQYGPIIKPDELVGTYEPLFTINEGGVTTWTGTQSQYDAITNKDSNTIYIITQ